jgi:hypothetical protein
MRSSCKHVGPDFWIQRRWVTCCHSNFAARGGETNRDSQENCSTIRRTVSQWVEMFKNGRIVIVDDGLPTTSRTAKNTEQVLWFKRTDGPRSLIQPRSWTSAVRLHVPSSAIASGITEFVQCGCQSTVQMSTKRHAAFAGISWRRRGISATDSHKGASSWTCWQKSSQIEKCAFCQQNDVDCFGTLMGPS